MSSPTPSPASFEVALHHRIGALTLDAAFTLTAPWTVLFAPSGAGKTTILRAIAGLLQPDSGRITAPGGAILLDTATRTAIPPHLRRIPFVAQHAALFPHRTVHQNLIYGMPPARLLQDRVEEIATLCRIGHVLTKRPHQLSGGERQRAVLARALAALNRSPALLLDEAFTGLDVTLRDAIVRDLKPWLAAQRVPVLHVTHDIAEVFAAEAEVLLLDAGRIAAQGPAPAILAARRAQLLQHLR